MGTLRSCGWLCGSKRWWGVGNSGGGEAAYGMVFSTVAFGNDLATSRDETEADIVRVLETKMTALEEEMLGDERAWDLTLALAGVGDVGLKDLGRTGWSGVRWGFSMLLLEARLATPCCLRTTPIGARSRWRRKRFGD